MRMGNGLDAPTPFPETALPRQRISRQENLPEVAGTDSALVSMATLGHRTYVLHSAWSKDGR